MAAHAPIQTINPETLVSDIQLPTGNLTDHEKLTYYADQCGLKDQFAEDLAAHPSNVDTNREFRYREYEKHGFAQGAVRALKVCLNYFSFIRRFFIFEHARSSSAANQYALLVFVWVPADEFSFRTSQVVE